MATTHKEIISQLDELEADIINKEAEVEERQKVLREDILANIKEARSTIVFINNAIMGTHDKETIQQLEELKCKLEEVIETSENMLK